MSNKKHSFKREAYRAKALYKVFVKFREEALDAKYTQKTGYYYSRSHKPEAVQWNEIKRLITVDHATRVQTADVYDNQTKAPIGRWARQPDGRLTWSDAKVPEYEKGAH